MRKAFGLARGWVAEPDIRFRTIKSAPIKNDPPTITSYYLRGPNGERVSMKLYDTEALAWQSFTVTDAILREALDALPLTIGWEYGLNDNGEPELILRDMDSETFHEHLLFTKRSEVDRIGTMALTIYLNQKGE